MAVVDVSNIGIGDVRVGGGIGQFNPSNPLTATEQDAASLAASDGGGGTGQIGETTTTTITDTSGAVSSVPTSRTISFTITSSPIGASILLDGVDTKFTTPHVMNFQETELLSPKIISVINGTNSSLETYIISSEVITTNTGTSPSGNSSGNDSNLGNSSGGGSGRGNSGGGGADSGNSNDPNDRRNFRFEVDGGARPRGNAQQ
jgi:hypothetical protein